MMADKNQQSLANGIPQLLPANTLQTNYLRQNQGEMMQTTGMDHSFNFNQLQKPHTSIINGQLSQNNRSSSWQPQSGHPVSNFSSNAGDSSLQQQSSTLPQQPLVMSPTKSSATYSGNPYGMEPSQNIHPPPTVPASNVSWKNTVQSSLMQMPPNTQSSKQNILKPTPIIGNRPTIPTSGIFQPAHSSGGGDAPVSQMYEQMAKTNPVSSQPLGKPATNPFPPQLQTNKVLNGPPISSGIASKSSLYDRPNLPNTSYTSPPTSQVMSVSQHQYLYQGSYSGSDPNLSQKLNASKSFPATSQPSSQQSGFPGPPQGYQLSTNQQPTTYKANLSDTPFTSEKHSVHNYTNTEQGAPMYQSQLAGITVPPPPLSDMPPSRNTHRLQSSIANRMPTTGGVSNMKHLGMNTLTQGMERMSVAQHGYNKLWVSVFSTFKQF